MPTIEEPPDAWWSPRPGERWAKARIDDAAALLRQVVDERDEADRIGRTLSDHVLSSFSAEHVVPLLIDALDPQPRPACAR